MWIFQVRGRSRVSTDDQSIPSVDTEYDGYKFRSRLEARWAVFFNNLGIDYRYEPQGFELPSGDWYLPDFYLPEVSTRSVEKEGMWIEVKPFEPDCTWNEGEFKKLAELAEVTNEPGAMLVGEVSNSPNDPRGEGMHFEADPEYHIDNWMFWMKCRSCGSVKFEFHESNYMYCEKCGGDCTYENFELEAAVVAARQARFEHGEKP